MTEPSPLPVPPAVLNVNNGCFAFVSEATGSIFMVEGKDAEGVQTAIEFRPNLNSLFQQIAVPPIVVINRLTVTFRGRTMTATGLSNQFRVRIERTGVPGVCQLNGVEAQAFAPAEKDGTGARTILIVNECKTPVTVTIGEVTAGRVTSTTERIIPGENIISFTTTAALAQVAIGGRSVSTATGPVFIRDSTGFCAPSLNQVC